MTSWQTLYGLVQEAAQDTSSDTLPYLKADLNRAIHMLEARLNLPLFEKTRSITTTTSDIYSLPQDCIRPKLLYVTISNVRYTAEIIQDEYTWQRIKANTSGITSNYLKYAYARPGSHQIEIYPTPSSAGNTMTLIYEASSKDLSADDYTTGTITTLANGGTAITGSGTTFTAAMVGRWFKTDDGYWYLIDSYASATAITLKQPYQGTAISGGSSTFTIGEMSGLPEGVDQYPVDYAAWKYFQNRKRDPVQAKIYQQQWEADLKSIEIDFTNRFTSSIVKSVRRYGRILGRNVNDYPQDLS